MGQKTNPIGNRLGIIRGWDSAWYGGKKFGDKLAEDSKIRKYIDSNFIITYGDGLANVNISELIDFHLNHKKIGTISVTNPTSRFGLVNFDSNNEVTSFIEKPNKKLAEKLFMNKKYTWNSGIFLFKASTILKELNKFAPQVVDICIKSLEGIQKDLNFQRINNNYFKIPSVLNIIKNQSLKRNAWSQLKLLKVKLNEF